MEIKYKIDNSPGEGEVETDEFEIVGSSQADRSMRCCVAQFLNNITFNDYYKKCVLEVKSNNERIKIFNILKEIRNSDNNKKRKK